MSPTPHRSRKPASRANDRAIDAPMGGAVTLRSSGTTGRVSVLVAGKSVGTLAGTVAEGLNLRGSKWTPGVASRVLQALREDEAARSAERLLAVRPRSKGELLNRLKQRGVGEALARDTVERFEKAGIVNDEAFARLMARATLSARPAGPRLLTAKLRGLRVDAQLAQTAAAEAVQGRDLLDDATALARKKLRAMPPKLDHATRQRRLLGALARRGYDAGVVYAAVRAALGGKMADAPAADE